MGSLSANKLNTYGPCGSHPEATLTHQPLVPLPPPTPRHCLLPPGRAPRGEGRAGKGPSTPTSTCLQVCEAETPL